MRTKTKIIIVVAIAAASVAVLLYLLLSSDSGFLSLKSKNILAKSGEVMSELDSLKFNYDQELSSESGDEVAPSQKTSCVGELKFPTDAAVECERTVSGQEEGSKMEEIVYYKNKVYIPLSALGEERQGEWVEVSADDSSRQALEVFYASNTLGFIASGGGEIVSEEQIEFEGEEASKVMFRVPFAKAKGVNPVLDILVFEDEEGEIQGEAVIDSDYRLLSLRMSSKSQDGVVITLSYRFSDFDQDVSIQKPENVISEPSLSGGEDEKDIGNIALRNSRRKSDIRQLAYILEEYYEQAGQYPESEEAVHTDDSKSDLYKALVPDIVENLPIDPLPEKYYYGYVCTGGEQYTLTAVLEVEDSEDTELFEYRGPK